MTDQYCIGTLCTSAGQEIPLESDITDSSSTQEIQTAALFTVVQQSIGDYAPGQVLTHGIVTSGTHIAFCYIVRQGLVAALIPVASRTAGGSGSNLSPTTLLKPFTLMAGDKVLLRTEA